MTRSGFYNDGSTHGDKRRISGKQEDMLHRGKRDFNNDVEPF